MIKRSLPAVVVGFLLQVIFDAESASAQTRIYSPHDPINCSVSRADFRAAWHVSNREFTALVKLPKGTVMRRYVKGGAACVVSHGGGVLTSLYPASWNMSEVVVLISTNSLDQLIEVRTLRVNKPQNPQNQNRRKRKYTPI